jgi:alkylated DNA repair protein (DNA oxidative demethylase)
MWTHSCSSNRRQMREAAEGLPEGFLLRTEFLTAPEEAELIEFVRRVAFGEVRMHGVAAKRRVAQFGWRYSFESYQLTPAASVPPALYDLRQRAAMLAKVEALDLSEVLVTEYTPGAGIGWHRDAPVFGIVAGVSLGAGCRMRFRTGEVRKWRTVAVELPARSIYVLSGSARKEWQHMIPPVHEQRWSITFRTLRRPPAAA